MKKSVPAMVAAIVLGSPALFAAQITGVASDGLAAAVANASAGDVIVLGEGTYTLAGEITIDKELTITGAGIDKTVIRQTTSNNRVLTLDHAQAKLEHLTLTGGKLTSERGNKSNDHGGCGVLVLSNGGILSYCRITGNSSTCNHNRGLGLEVHSSAAAVSHCMIDGNKVTGGSNGCYAGAYLLGGTYDHCLFYGNIGHNGGGVCIGGSIVMSYCTIAGNTVRSEKNGAGGIYLRSCGSSVISNSVIACNFCTSTDTSAGKPEWGGSSACTFVNTAFPEGVAINTSILKGTPLSSTPLFVDAEKHDYRQRLVSPTRDIGYYTPFNYETLQCDFTLSSSETFTNETAVAFLPHVAGTAGATTSFTWTVTAPDGTATTLSGASPSFTPAQIGRYDVALSVSVEGAGTATCSQADCLLASSRLFAVASKAELLSALDLAIDGTTISCAAGEYALTAQIALEKAIALIGPGYDRTTLRQTASNTRVVYMDDPGARVQGFTITGARITSEGVHGCGVHIALGGGTLAHCRVTDNQHKCNWTYGMGVYMISTSGLVDHCVIDNNTKTGGSNGQYGGGAYASKGVFDNCLVYDNGPAQYGGGIYIDGAVTVQNCSFVRNSSYATGGNVYWNATAAVFRNSLFALAASGSSDTTAGIPEWACSGNNKKASFSSCLFPAAIATNACTGGDCILGDAVFADASADDFHPLAASPSRDAGTAYTGLSATDLDGVARTQGDAVDIGCYEFNASSASCSFTGGGSVLENTAVLFSSAVSGVGEGGDLAYAWVFANHDGTTYQYGTRDVEFPCSRAGWYDVTLVVTPAGGDALSSSVAGALYVCPRHIYVNGDEEHGATNLFDAVAMAIGGARIHVEEGTYALTNRLDVTAGIAITGAGIDRTVLRGAAEASAPRSLLYVNHEDALVEHLTLSGFRASKEVTYRGAVILDAKGGTLSRCRITDNRYVGENVNHARGIGVTLNGAKALVTHCVIDRNQGSESYYGDFGGGVYGLAGAIENSLVCFNTNRYGGGIAIEGAFTVRNCTVYGNVASGAAASQSGVGGGSLFFAKSGGTLVNTIFAAGEDLGSAGYAGSPEWNGNVTDYVFQNCAFPVGVALPANASDTLSCDPLFRDAASGDFRLKSASPCVHAGLTNGWSAADTDLAGAPRVVRGAIDIGAYQNQSLPHLLLLVK